ncbi:MAG: hypothetical protein ACAI38_06740 [Myxococcota bacterium]
MSSLTAGALAIVLLAAGNDPPPADGSAKPKPTVVSAKTGKVVRQGAGTGAKTKPPAPRSSSKADSPGRRTAARPTRSVPNAVDDYVLPKVVQDIYRDRGYELPRIGAVDSRTAEDIELGRGFAGNINDKLRTLQQDEGIERRGIVDPKLERAAQRPAGLYARLQPLNGPELINELDVVGREIMQQYPPGTPVRVLREAYTELVQFVSERTGVSIEKIYRVMDLESYGGQYWAAHSAGACGLVQVRPIALEEMQRLRPSEFRGLTFSAIRQNPALNLYTGMSYAQEKKYDWNHYSGGARGYADYVLYGVPKGS